MLNDYEERQTEGFLYSPALDLLLTWGSGSLFQGTEDEGEFVQGIEEEWHSLMEESDVKSELHSGLEALTQDINDALDFLCHAIPESDRETALAQTALEILDHGVRLFQTTRNFSEQNHFPEGFQVRAEALFRNITVDCAPSYIRLIPLNYWRQFMRGNISEHSFHLFPWYDEWADMPSETIEILIENWNEISHGNFECSEMDTETLKVLFAELSNDRELLNYIQEEARFGHILPRAIGKSLVLRLLMIRNEEVGKHAAPQKVREKGFVACACHIIQKIKKIFRSEEERLEGIFLSGFCGPHLRENQRTELFTQVEHELKTLDVSLRPGSLLEELCQWSQGKVADEVFSRRVFEHWNNELSLSAKAVTERVPEDAAIFLRAVNELAFAKLETETVAEKIEQGIGRLFDINKLIDRISSPTVQLEDLGYAGDDDDDDDDDGSVTLPRMVNVCAQQEGNMVNLLEDSETIPDEIEQLLQKETGEVPEKLIPIMDSGENRFLYQILRESNGKWLSCLDEFGETYMAEIKVTDAVPDRFRMLLDEDRNGLRQSVDVMLNGDDTEYHQLSPDTIIVDVEILNQEGGSR